MAIKSLINKKRIHLNRMGSFLTGYSFDLNGSDYELFLQSTKLFEAQKKKSKELDDEWIKQRMLELSQELDYDE